MSEIQLIHGNCLTEMNKIEPGSIDLILCDLPYGTTQNKWDSIIPLDQLWRHYKRILKPDGSVVLTATQPFTTNLIISNREWYKHSWVWNKKSCGSFATAKFRPLVITEDILVFSENGNYYPQMIKRGKPRNKDGYSVSSNWGIKPMKTHNLSNEYYPKNLIEISNANNSEKGHPTQKPVALMEYLIKTYTNEGDLVLDNCMGSGTTGIACLNTGRNFIGIEKEEIYFQLAESRITAHSEYQKSLKSEYIPPIVKLYKERYDGSATIPYAILEKLKQYFSVELVNNFYSIK